MKEELSLLQEPGSYIGEVVKVMGKTKVLVKAHPDGKYVVDFDRSIDLAKLTPGGESRIEERFVRVALHIAVDD